MSQDRRVAEGRTAELFAWGARHVLKLFRPDWSVEVAEHEAALARTVHATGLATPAVVDVVVEDGRAGIIYERADGPTMLQMMLASPSEALDSARLLAELHVAMHNRSGPGLPPLRQRLRRKIEHAPPLPGDWKTAILARLDRLPDGDAICHGDFHPDNVVMTAGGPIIIDWIDAAQGQPLADVSRTLLLAGHGAPLEGSESGQLDALRRPLVEAYLARYRELRPFDPADLDAWRLPVTAGRLSEGIAEEEASLLAVIDELLNN